MHTRVYESDAPKEAFIFLYSQSGDMQEYKMCIHRNTYAYITCTYHNVTHVGLFSHGKKMDKKIILSCELSHHISVSQWYHFSTDRQELVIPFDIYHTASICVEALDTGPQCLSSLRSSRLQGSPTLCFPLDIS